MTTPGEQVILALEIVVWTTKLDMNVSVIELVGSVIAAIAQSTQLPRSFGIQDVA